MVESSSGKGRGAAQLIGLAGAAPYLLTAFLLFGCDSQVHENSYDIGRDTDGGWDVAADLGPLDPVQVGSPATLEAVTWNLRNYPEEAVATFRVVDFLKRMDPDLVGVQEVNGEAPFVELVAALGNHDGLVSAEYHHYDGQQRPGIIYRRGMFTLLRSESLFTEDGSAFPRAPLLAEFQVTREGGSSEVTLVAIVLHLKAQTDRESWARREDAMNKLKAYVDGRLRQDPGQLVLLLGDFNDTIDSISKSPFACVLEDPERYQFLTAELDPLTSYSYIPYPRLIDHLLVTRSMLMAFPRTTVRILELERHSDGFSYLDEVSDHRPVAGIFYWP